ncbi:release factor glutamine methyltransferase [Dissulfurispira thermophila]|uniref:Release factor glutamine methyltransferase n=1 Tax=Dissulfurispira thermophila TaxID=2715679 RepID=A0A7G1H3F5_9BACT|nr:peptide chain release factor N(5)-glutamine methyltransferase [Dissulfurispira thermophila]BCB97248.1 release factor glutamine methyltransferase [Dissulfurispira thermophila]
MNAINKLKEISAFLGSKGIEDAVKDAEILITETLHISKSKLYSGDLEISEATSKQIDALTSRLAGGEPLQYIIGHVNFYGLKINVGRGVLIPRPETELLVEEAIKQLEEFMTFTPKFTVLDLCTGSGCIAITLAKHFPDADVYGIDKSNTAIEYAVRNAVENNIKNVHFIKGDLFKPVDNMVFDCIVSNPPYIKTDDIQSLQKEIKDYEPIDALDGGADGLDFYRMILKNAPKFLKENGIIILEIGYNQADDVKNIAMNANFRNVIFIKDYSGVKRIFIGRKK